MRTGIGLIFFTPMSHDGKSYKVMIDGDGCMNIISKSVVERMGLNANHIHNRTLSFDKSFDSIIQHYLVPIQLSSYNGRIWCDILCIDDVCSLLGRP